MIDAVENLASADPADARKPDIWDKDLLLLITPAGIVNLATGALMEHDAERHMTKMTAVAPDNCGHCPRWPEFLRENTNSDEQLIGFLRRMSGYCLSGSTSEHPLFFCYGPGGNGKSVFIKETLK
jgi:putative DNA primase/helicase